MMNVAPALLDLYGPKYLILVLDDFQQNHINNGLVTITELSRDLKVPSYYNAKAPRNCTNRGIFDFNAEGADTTGVPFSGSEYAYQDLYDLAQQTSSSQGLLFAEKLNVAFKAIPQILPTAPRTLTQAQIYTVNEIIKNNERNTNIRASPPSSSDTFALIPIKRSGNNTGDVYVEFSGSVQDNKRVYFGPVNIHRMTVSLINDRGEVVDLNGANWSFSILCEQLYQQQKT
jgi:hypothetical protein